MGTKRVYKDAYSTVAINFLKLYKKPVTSCEKDTLNILLEHFKVLYSL